MFECVNVEEKGSNSTTHCSGQNKTGSMTQSNGTNGPTGRGKILVIGAGYAGLATAIKLVRVGYEVEVIEAIKQLSTQGMTGLILGTGD